jgi:secreted effector protein SseC
MTFVVSCRGPKWAMSAQSRTEFNSGDHVSGLKGGHVSPSSSISTDHAEAGIAPLREASTRRRSVVSPDGAADALRGVLSKLENATAGGISSASVVWGNVSMESMLLATTLLTTKVMSNTAEMKGRALQIISSKEEDIRHLEIREYRAQIDKAIDLHRKAKMASIVDVIFDWIIPAVEIASGVAKIAGGMMIGNPLIVAGGAMDLMAGFSGVIRASMNTIALVHTENAPMYRELAAIAGGVQLTFEILGASVDVTSAARNMLLGRAISKATTKILDEDAMEALQQAIKSARKDALDGAAQVVGRNVAGQMPDRVPEKCAKAMLGASCNIRNERMHAIVTKFGESYTFDPLAHEWIEETVTKSVRYVIAENAGLTGQQLTQAIVKRVDQDSMLGALKRSTGSLVGTARAIAVEGRNVASGVLALERAQLQSQIDQLILDQQWLAMCLQFCAHQKDDQRKVTKELIEKACQAAEDGSQALQRSATVQAHVAASIV